MSSHLAQEGTRWAQSVDHGWSPLRYLQWHRGPLGPKRKSNN